MNDLIDQEGGPALDIARETTEVLKRRLAHQMELSARHLVEMAGIWTELERRGEDLSALRTGLTDYLPRIAAGELDAQAVVQFAGNRQLLRYLSTLSVSEQQALMDRGSVQLYLPESDQTTSRKLSQLSGREITQVFGRGVIRSPGEQQQIARAKKSVNRVDAEAKKAESMRIHYGVLEINGQRVYVDGQPLKAAQLLEALSRHYNVDLARTVSESR